MHQDRVFDSAQHFRSGADEPPRIVITESADAAVVAWCVEPGQSISLHVHPSGQDTWIVLSGRGSYYLDSLRTALPLSAGVVAVAPSGAVHGALNTGTEPLRFISVVSPADAGYAPLPPVFIGD